MRGEFDWIRTVRAVAPSGPDVRVGIGDDCAVLNVDGGQDLLVTTDTLVEDVHFVRAGLSPDDLGWKALAVSISDVAAMGGRAQEAVVAASFPPSAAEDFADGVLRGLVACAERYGVALVGGDTTGSKGPVVITTTVLGRVPRGRAVLRSGARPGDAVAVTGALGGSLLGRHLRVTPRQEEALTLVQGDGVHAMIDLSDGLSSDLFHVLRASGVGAEIDAARVPLHDDARRAARADGRTALTHALDDGEDFELLVFLDAGRAQDVEASGLVGTPFTVIGRVVEAPGAWLIGADGGRTPLQQRGYDHFRTA